MLNHKEEWENSYQNRDNYVFAPHEEVVRFVSKYIKKRIGYDDFITIYPTSDKPKILDLGCGIGRHVIFASKMGLDGYGIDLSEHAIATARDWADRENVPTEGRVVQGDITSLPWDNGTFQFVISHGVLDSMYFAIAQKAVKEVHRVLEQDGLFYCDLVSGDDSAHSREYAGEEVVESSHEKGTVQSYYNFSKINELIKSKFEIVEAVLIKRENILSGHSNTRYHLVLKKKV